MQTASHKSHFFIKNDVNKFFIHNKVGFSGDFFDNFSYFTSETYIVVSLYTCPSNPIALRKAKIVYNFGLSECNTVKAVLMRRHN